MLLLLSLALACWLAARSALEELRRGQEVDTLILASPLDPADFKEMVRREAEAGEGLNFALWTELGGEWIEAPGLERGVSAAVLPVRGDTRLVLPLAAGLEPEDGEGCLLDADTARKLFGSANAQGATLRWRGKDYTVRGVFHAPAGAVVLRPNAGEALDRVSVAGAALSSFERRHSLHTTGAVRGDVLTQVARLLCGTPLLLAGLLLCVRCARLTLASYGLPVRTGLACAGFLALGCGCFLLALTLLPDPLIPSRWSDFQHWSSALEGAWESICGWLGAAWYRPDRRLLALLARSGLGPVAGVCLLGALRFRTKQ